MQLCSYSNGLSYSEFSVAIEYNNQRIYFKNYTFADNVPPEALPSELAAFLNIPLETSDTKLEMAMDMRTGMCKGIIYMSKGKFVKSTRCTNVSYVELLKQN